MTPAAVQIAPDSGWSRRRLSLARARVAYKLLDQVAFVCQKQLDVFCQMRYKEESTSVRRQPRSTHTSGPVIHSTKQMFTQVQMKQVDNSLMQLCGHKPGTFEQNRHKIKRKQPFSYPLLRALWLVVWEASVTLKDFLAGV